MALGDPIDINLDRKTGRKWYIGQRDNPQLQKNIFKDFTTIKKKYQDDVSNKYIHLYDSLMIN